MVVNRYKLIAIIHQAWMKKAKLFINVRLFLKINSFISVKMLMKYHNLNKITQIIKNLFHNNKKVDNLDSLIKINNLKLLFQSSKFKIILK